MSIWDTYPVIPSIVDTGRYPDKLLAVLQFRYDILLHRCAEPDHRILIRLHGREAYSVPVQNDPLRFGQNPRIYVGIFLEYADLHIQYSVKCAEQRRFIFDCRAVLGMTRFVRPEIQYSGRCRDNHLRLVAVVIKAGVQTLGNTVRKVNVSVAPDRAAVVHDAVNHDDEQVIGQLIILLQIGVLGRRFRAFISMVSARSPVDCATGKTEQDKTDQNQICSSHLPLRISFQQYHYTTSCTEKEEVFYTFPPSEMTAR